MHRILHLVIAVLRLIYRTIYHYGPAVLAKYTMPCTWLIAAMCLGAGIYDLLRGRRFDAVLWGITAGLVYTAFRTETGLSDPRMTVVLATGAAAAGILLLARSLVEWFRREQ